MNNLILEKTDNTPGVMLDGTQHLVEFIGDSRPENAKLFFEPIFNWIKEYENHLYYLSNEASLHINTNVNFKLEYFNSSSARYVIDIIKALHTIELSNKKVTVVFNWFFDSEDEDLKDSGLEFVKMTGIPMNFTVK